MEPSDWCLIFSDGTGQRGVRDDKENEVNEFGVRTKNTNVFQMYAASDGKPYLKAFYDPGLGAPETGAVGWGRMFGDLWAKATGWGITANIADCYEGVLMNWRPGLKIGLFGFSRGAYTVRCLGGVLSICGIATRDAAGRPISTAGEARSDTARRAVAEKAVAIYKIEDRETRLAEGRQFAAQHGCDATMPSVIGVFDTVESIGVPGLYNPWQQRFHDRTLSSRVPVGLHALSIDENRKSFLPVLWDPVSKEGAGAGQVIEQQWFPGVHSDIGGGYEERKLSDLTLNWMLSRLRDVAHLHIPLTIDTTGNIDAPGHDERTGFGILWQPAQRTLAVEARDNAALCADIERRYQDAVPAYRPNPLRRHPRVMDFYG